MGSAYRIVLHKRYELKFDINRQHAPDMNSCKANAKHTELESVICISIDEGAGEHLNGEIALQAIRKAPAHNGVAKYASHA